MNPNNSANSQKNSVESGGVDGFVSDAMSIVIKDVISFPNEIRDEDTILKEQKGGKRGDKVSVKVGLLDNELYIQYKAGNLRGNRMYWATIKIPNATNYSAGQLRYRLDYAGTTTDVARLAGDAILELFNKNDLRLHKADWKEVTDNADAALRDALVSVLRGAGIIGDGTSILLKTFQRHCQKPALQESLILHNTGAEDEMTVNANM